VQGAQFRSRHGFYETGKRALLSLFFALIVSKMEYNKSFFIALSCRRKYRSLFPAFFYYNIVRFAAASFFKNGNGTPGNPEHRSAVTDG
jgi:hypothetical protein